MNTRTDAKRSSPGHISVRALFFGERLDLRTFELAHCLALSPLVIRAGASGYAVLFRYGVVVLFGLTAIEEVGFLDHLQTLTHGRFPNPETEEASLSVQPDETEGVNKDGVIVLNALTPERLQVVADILAKSVVLAQSENDVAKEFDRIEPLAVGLQKTGKIHRQGRKLTNYIGGALLTQHRTVGRVAIVEKPDLLWEHPELERLYYRLSYEYELGDRQVVLESKLKLIANTAQTLLDLLQNRRSLRVEWYIVVLILVEIMLTLYELFIHPQAA